MWSVSTPSLMTRPFVDRGYRYRRVSRCDPTRIRWERQGPLAPFSGKAQPGHLPHPAPPTLRPTPLALIGHLPGMRFDPFKDLFHTRLDFPGVRILFHDGPGKAVGRKDQVDPLPLLRSKGFQSLSNLLPDRLYEARMSITILRRRRSLGRLPILSVPEGPLRYKRLCSPWIEKEPWARQSPL